MRHHRHSIRFGRQRSHYNATLRALARSVILRKSIRTTKTKAKEASRMIDRLISLGKKKTVLNQRRAFDILRDRSLVKILFDEIAPLFQSRNGGYTRVILLSKRKGDNSQMALLELVEKPKAVERKKEKEKKEEITKPVEEKSTERKGEFKKEEPPKELKRPERPLPKPGFFKRIFGRKGER